MTNYGSLSHTKWECKYHVVFIPKYRRKMIYGGIRRHLLKLLTRELADPIPALNKVIDEGIRPQVDLFLQAVSDLLGPQASAIQIKRCTGRILGQCLHYHFEKPVIGRLVLEDRLDALAVPQIADHIIKFSLAGLSRMKRDGRQS